MDDDIETSQRSQEPDSDVDIGMKASMYTSATLKEMYTVGLTLRNNLHNCISAWYKNWPPHASDITGIMLMFVDVLIVACAITESYAIVKDSERQCPKPLKILNIRPNNQTSAERSLLVLGTWVSVLSPY
jgi:hypothetical protein